MFDFNITQYITLSMTLIALGIIVYFMYGEIVRNYLVGTTLRVVDNIMVCVLFLPVIVSFTLSCDMIYRIVTQNLGGV